ncbi:MAG: hypothetical protein CMP41_00715 [Rickettsiales bacterium]|nr:hypothetical protein [Rickettsiales bacterium]
MFNFNNKAKKINNKLSFFIKKNKVSFLAYELLKKYVVNQVISADKLDFAYPKNWNPTVLKNVSPRSMKTLYRLSDTYSKNKHGIIAQKFITNYESNKKKLSPHALRLLNKINSSKPRYNEIDLLIKKYKINKALE